MVKLDELTKKVATVLLSCLLIFFLWWHYQLSITRYFDVDEFAHLSWAAHWVAGNTPYIDFLTFFPPGFAVFLAPLFFFGNTGVTPILAARFMIFLTYLSVLAGTGYLFWLLRRSWVWIVAVVLLAFLPLPKDKFIEIRPDSLATLLGLVALIFQIRWMRTWNKRDGFLGGFFNAVSLIVLPKMLPQVIVAIAIGLVAGVGGVSGFPDIKKKKDHVLPMLAGLVFPFTIFGIWALSLGNLGVVWYSLTKLPFEANKISEIFIMLPNLFFYPNGIFYGENGYSLGVKMNHTIWLAGFLFGAYRLITPYLTKEKHYIYEELLVSSIFYVHILSYAAIVPLKHTQYLIPIAVFVSFFAADAVDQLWQSVRRNVTGLVAFLFFVILGSVFLFEAYVQTNREKLTWTNREALASLTHLYKTIPTSDYILDLDGRTMYYPYPYYACCIPFGQSSPFLSRPLPSLADALERTKTKYIFQGELKRTDTLRPEDQAYIQAHFTPYNGDDQLLVRN